jgi:hypothetical protein
LFPKSFFHHAHRALPRAARRTGRRTILKTLTVGLGRPGGSVLLKPDELRQQRDDTNPDPDEIGDELRVYQAQSGDAIKGRAAK